MLRSELDVEGELELELLLFARGPFRSSSRPLFVLVRVALHYMAASKPNAWHYITWRRRNPHEALEHVSKPRGKDSALTGSRLI